MSVVGARRTRPLFRSMIRRVVSLVLLVLAAAHGALAIDQHFEVPGNGSGVQIFSVAPAGQSFRPSKSPLIAVEVQLGILNPPGSDTLTLRIRSGSITGTILASTSLPVNTSGWQRFIFSSPLAVVPDDIYVIELVPTNNALGWVVSGQNTPGFGYPDGTAIYLGQPAPLSDFVFRTYDSFNCGNGILDPGEQCDDGNNIDGDGCDANCTPTACGNGIHTAGEDCDDGNTVSGDGCDSNCTFPRCGNGVTAGTEQCDDGNAVDGDGCDSNCTHTACGNGVVTTGEECDDGNLVDGDGCDANCQFTPPAVLGPIDQAWDGTGTGCSLAGGEVSLDVGLGQSFTATQPLLGAVGVNLSTQCVDGGDPHCTNTSWATPLSPSVTMNIRDGSITGSIVATATQDIITPGWHVFHFTPQPVLVPGNLYVIDLAGGSNSFLLWLERDCDYPGGTPIGGGTVGGVGNDYFFKTYFKPCGNGTRDPGEQCDDGNAVSGDGCEPDCTFTPVTVTATVPAGGTVTTDTTNAGATAAFPTQVGVTVPDGGQVSIATSAVSTLPANGFTVLGVQALITAPPATSAPLQVVFTVDESVIPAGIDPATLVVFKDGAPVQNCTGGPGVASPDPCVASRTLLGNGDLQFTILTSTASTWDVAAPAHDSGVLPIPPITATVPRGASSVAKMLTVKVFNADVLPVAETPGHTIQLIASDGDCPAGTITDLPDFDTKTSVRDDTVQLAGGNTAKAQVPIRLASSGTFTSFNKMAPARCNLSFHVVSTVAGNTDPNPANDTVTAEVNFFDPNPPPQTAVHESVLASTKSIKIAIAKPRVGAAVPKKVKLMVTVLNADLGEDPGHDVQVTATDGDCPLGTVGSVYFRNHKPDANNKITIKGGKKVMGTLTLNANPAAFKTTNAVSPARCTALLTATGDPGDTQTTNNTGKLVIDVIDKNDL